MRDIRGTTDGASLRVAIAVARYNEAITRGLLAGAREALAECGVPDDAITVAQVPGALELPLAALALARGDGAHRPDAVVVLGAVIRGETSHYDYVCAESTRGCGQVALETGIPVLFGVLTCETLAQARDRSGATPKNKGREAALSAVEMATLLPRVRGRDAATPFGFAERTSRDAGDAS